MVQFRLFSVSSNGTSSEMISRHLSLKQASFHSCHLSCFNVPVLIAVSHQLTQILPCALSTLIPPAWNPHGNRAGTSAWLQTLSKYLMSKRQGPRSSPLVTCTFGIRCVEEVWAGQVWKQLPSDSDLYIPPQPRSEQARLESPCAVLVGLQKESSCKTCSCAMQQH